jgi:hypothetical protein
MRNLKTIVTRELAAAGISKNSSKQVAMTAVIDRLLKNHTIGEHEYQHGNSGCPERGRQMNIIDKIILILDRLFDLLPIYKCWGCNKWFARKDISFRRTTIGVDGPVCHKCWDEINHIGRY